MRTGPTWPTAVVSDHERLDGTFAAIVDVTRIGADAGAGERRRLAQLAYLQLSSFTSAYLAHQAVEELEISPALERALGPEAMSPSTWRSSARSRRTRWPRRCR